MGERVGSGDVKILRGFICLRRSPAFAGVTRACTFQVASAMGSLGTVATPNHRIFHLGLLVISNTLYPGPTALAQSV